MKARLALFVAGDAVEDIHDGPDVDVQAGLLFHLPRETFRERFADLQRAARKAPPPGQRLETALDEQHAPVDEHHAADADNRPRRVFPPRRRAVGSRCAVASCHYCPITFTTTRFLRWPSNSA